MRYAICNETFEGWDHARICQFIAGLGYSGLELAPFTLAPRITDADREAHRAFIATLGDKPIWNDFLPAA